MPADNDNTKLLELAPAELLVPLKVSHAGRSYRLQHCLRPPAPADWFAYEAALEMAVEELPADADDEPCYRLHVRSSDAARLLWDRLALSVEGYELPPGHRFSDAGKAAAPAATTAAEGHGFSRAAINAARSATAEEALGNPARVSPLELTSRSQDWHELIPLAHKEAAVNSLTLVAPGTAFESANHDSSNNFFPLLADERCIALEAVRGGRAYPRLVHRFRPPSVEDERAYRRLLSETLLVRGSRAPRTLLPARLPGLVRLYDQLILGAEGYSLHGSPLTSHAQTGVRMDESLLQMDAWHKRVAVQALFGDLAATAASEDPSMAESPA